MRVKCIFNEDDHYIVKENEVKPTKVGFADVIKGDTGNGIESTTLNADYTLTINFTDGTSYTTPPIRGERGADGEDGLDGVGIASTRLNADYTLTITLTNGSSYTTPPIRGEKGIDGHTPIKGVDYFTPIEVANIADEIRNDVMEVVPTKTSQLENDSNFLTQHQPLKTVNGNSLIGEGDIHIEGGGSGTSNYNDLLNKPSINGIDLVGNKTTTDLLIDIPTKLSELTNDVGFIDDTYHDDTKQNVLTEADKQAIADLKVVPTNVSAFTNDSGYVTSSYHDSTKVDKVSGKSLISDSEITRLANVKNYDDSSIKNDIQLLNDNKQNNIDDLDAIRSGASLGATALQTEVDPTVPNWAKQPNKPSYTATEVGALPNTTVIPSKTSQLQNDSGFLTQHQSLTDYAKKTDLPTKTSQLTNDSGFAQIDDTSSTSTETWSSNKISNKFDEVEMAKSPNVTIIGHPTFQNGQLSGFSTTNYAQFPFIVDFKGLPFEINLEMTTGTDVSNQHNILDSNFGLAFAVRQNRFVIALSTNGTSWNIGEGIGTHSILTQTTYRVRMVWNLSTFVLSYSIDGGQTYITDITKALTSQPYPKQMFIGVTSNVVDPQATNVTIFNGSINLNNCSLKISNVLVWVGMDASGLDTRANVSLSNIDELGEQKIKDVVGEIPSAVTEQTVANWGFTKNTGTYSKPSGGIPKTDLASSVQTSLGKADSALQSFTETDPTVPSHVKSITSADISNWNGKTTVTESTVSGWGFTKNSGTYSKPSTGIPKTDLASAVQTSLGKADTALQSFTETDPTVPSWAKADTKPTYTASEVGARPSTWTPTKSDIGLGNVGNFKAVSTVASQGLTDTEKSNARANIGASSFSGSYTDLTNKPTIPTVPTNVSAFTNDSGYLTQHQDISGKQDKITSSAKLSASLVSGLSTVATSGSYNDLSNKPTIPDVPVTRLYSNISVSKTPSALSSYCVWDTQKLYGYYFDVTVNGITTNSLIENIMMTDTLLATVGYVVTTNANSLRFYTQTNDAVSGTILSLYVKELNDMSSYVNALMDEVENGSY